MSREEQLLKSTAQQVHPSPSFTNELEKKLMNTHKPTKVGSFSIKKFAFTAGWVVVLAALALTFIWVIGSIAPRSKPQPAAGNTLVPNVETTPQSSKLIDYTVKEGDTCAFIAGKYGTTVEEIMKHNNLTGACRIMIDQVLKIPVKADSANLPQGKAYKTSMGKFVMTVNLPEGAPQAILYQLDSTQENEKYKVVKILELAARVGMNGTLYRLSEKNGGPGLIYTDGKQRIEVNNYAPHQFSYYPDYITYPLIVNQGNVLSPAEVSAKAEEFLKAHKLLDLPYQIEHSTDANSRLVTFVPRLNDLPDPSYIFPNFATLQVSFDQNSEIASVDWKVQPWEAKGSYPLISAQQAWDKFLTNELNGLGIEMDSGGYSPSLSGPTLKLWKRDIPLNQPTSLIGTVTSFDPVDGNTPLFIIDNISLTGNLGGLTYLQEPVQLDGQYIMDGDVKKFQVDSWKTVDFVPTPLQGTLEQVDGQNWLVTTDGKRLQMEDLPKDIQIGEKTSVKGIVSGDKLDWKTIHQGQGGGGGGGGGGGSGLARLNLSGTPMPTATPWPAPTPADYSSLIGSRLEGEHGIVDVFNLKADDGSMRFAYKLTSNSESGFLNLSFGQVNLEGPATEGLKAYYHMPIKIWGTITSINPPGPTIQLERYEALYPDEKVQLWFGEEKTAQVDGKSALLFTTNDGTTYIRDDSIESGEKPITPEKGYVFHIAGWSDPNETLSGYPVVHVMSVGLLPKDYDFNSIITGILTPPIMNESNMNVSGEPQTGIINRVELVYLGEDQLLAQAEEGRVLYAQPFWRFSGYYNENSFFNIIVQALPDKYLQPVSLQ